jgi:hypothetical protein
MRLGTLFIAALLGIGAVYVTHNAGSWLNDLRGARTQLTGALAEQAAAEENDLRAALKTRLARQRVRAAAAARKAAQRDAAAPRSAARRAASGARSTTRPLQGPAVPQTTTALVGLTESDFWQLISETRNAAGNDTAAQSQLLEQRLTQMPPQAIVEFAQIRRRLDEQAYTWDLWGAADVIEDGCSDDCFRDFRGYLISLGQGPYENALSSPDSLASVVQDDQAGDWASAYDAAPQAYAAVTGGQLPVSEFEPAADPAGTPFDPNDEAGLAARYPQLAARFR